jgi:hypothetical protein
MRHPPGGGENENLDSCFTRVWPRFGRSGLHADASHHKIHTERVERSAISRGRRRPWCRRRESKSGGNMLTRASENCNRTICYDGN